MNYSMDVFVEYMVKKKKSLKDIAIIAGTFILAFLIFNVAFIFLPQFLDSSSLSVLFLLLAGLCYAVYYVSGMFNLEFEYAFTNGDISIDKIMARKSRKRLTSFECKAIEEMGEYSKNTQKLEGRSFDKKIFSGMYEDGRDSIYVVVDSKKTGRTLVVFDPDERMLEAMKTYVSRQVKVDFYGR